MKKMILVMSMLMILLYMTMAFTFLSFNPIEWHWIGRLLYIAIGFWIINKLLED
jgi:hypothetical protein